MQALIELGADVNAKTEDGRTALSFSTGYKHRGVVEVLLAAGGVMGKGEVISKLPKGMAGSLKSSRVSDSAGAGGGGGGGGGGAGGGGGGDGTTSESPSRKRSKPSVDGVADGSKDGGGAVAEKQKTHFAGNNRLHWVGDNSVPPPLPTKFACGP